MPQLIWPGDLEVPRGACGDPRCVSAAGAGARASAAVRACGSPRRRAALLPGAATIRVTRLGSPGRCQGRRGPRRRGGGAPPPVADRGDGRSPVGWSRRPSRPGLRDGHGRPARGNGRRASSLPSPQEFPPRPRPPWSCAPTLARGGRPCGGARRPRCARPSRAGRHIEDASAQTTRRRCLSDHGVHAAVHASPTSVVVGPGVAHRGALNRDQRPGERQDHAAREVAHDRTWRRRG